ncbi:hypothetical protein Droror1_Dr00020445 [Drosera rotundifolia]
MRANNKKHRNQRNTQQMENIRIQAVRENSIEQVSRKEKAEDIEDADSAAAFDARAWCLRRLSSGGLGCGCFDRDGFVVFWFKDGCLRAVRVGLRPTAIVGFTPVQAQPRAGPSGTTWEICVEPPTWIIAWLRNWLVFGVVLRAVFVWVSLDSCGVVLVVVSSTRVAGGEAAAFDARARCLRRLSLGGLGCGCFDRDGFVVFWFKDGCLRAVRASGVTTVILFGVRITASGVVWP